MDKWFQLLVTGITMGSVYALIALGFVTIYRSSRIVNMAQGSFVMFGGLFAFSMFQELGLPYWLAAIIGTILVVIVAVIMWQIVLKPVLKISLVTMILCTVALSLLFENLSLVSTAATPRPCPAFGGDHTLRGGRRVHQRAEPLHHRHHDRRALSRSTSSTTAPPWASG